MATARRLVEADRYAREGRFTQWEYMLLLGGDIHGKTLGVVGFGRIGRAMARRALGLRHARALSGRGGRPTPADEARAQARPASTSPPSCASPTS